MPKTKIALVLSGGTSAGAYIAGALDELMRAFSHTDKYEIDIITGASAGATTAALLAHGLWYRGGNTRLEHVWVDRIDIVDLLRPDLEPGQPLSLLSPTVLREIAKEELDWPDGERRGDRAAFCAESLTVAMTLANATALRYDYHVKPPTSYGPEPLIAERNAEQETFFLSSTTPPQLNTWYRMAEVAQASAAIPFIFPMVRLSRQAEDRSQYLLQPMDFSGERHFWYYDGGAYSSLPIELAWHYIQHQAKDTGSDPASDRRIVVINPWRHDPPTLPETTRHPDPLTQAIRVYSE